MPDSFRVGRHRGRWVAISGHGAGKRRRALAADSKAEALRQIRELNQRAAHAERGSTTTVETVFSLYVEDRERDGVPSVKRMREAWKPLSSHFAHLQAASVDKAACQAYIKRRRRLGVSDGGIRTELDYLSTALRFGMRAKLYTGGAPAIERPPQPRPRDRWLTKAQVVKLVRAAKAPHVKLFILLAIATAGRPSHILQLTWDRVDLQRRVINLDDPERDRTKKGRAEVPINDDILEPLRMARDLATTGNVIEYNEQPLLSVKKSIAAAAKRARIKGVGPYVLRHTAGVWMAQAGVPIEEIAQYMGHTSPSVTFRVYARYSPEHMKRAAGALLLDEPLQLAAEDIAVPSMRGHVGTNHPARREQKRTK